MGQVLVEKRKAVFVKFDSALGHWKFRIGLSGEFASLLKKSPIVVCFFECLLATLLAYDPFSRGLRLGALIYSAIGVGFSIYFSYLQVTFIHAFCVYCLASAVITVLLLIAAISRFRFKQK